METIRAFQLLRELDGISGENSQEKDVILDELTEILSVVSHSEVCPYRHHGECLCARSLIIEALLENGREVP